MKIPVEMIDFIKILDDVQIDDQLQLKLMILADCLERCPKAILPITAVFMVAKARQPLLLEMKEVAHNVF